MRIGKTTMTAQEMTTQETIDLPEGTEVYLKARITRQFDEVRGQNVCVDVFLETVHGYEDFSVYFVDPADVLVLKKS